MGKEQKKFQKKKERERAVARKLQLQRTAKQYTDNYPVFVEDPRGNPKEIPEAFVKAVKFACKQIRFDNSELFAPVQQEAYRYVKKQGQGFIKDWVSDSNCSIEMLHALTAYMLKVGTVIFDLIGDEQLSKWIPYHDVRLVPFDGDFIVQFRSLKQKSTTGGITYYSSKKPKLLVNGKNRIIGFSTHAIQQICNRVVPTWRTYGGMGDAFAIFEQCSHYEPASIVNESLAFTFYDVCIQGFFSWNYVKELVDTKIEPDGNYYYRVGYCPSVIEDEFIKAKTLLCPGYHGTPEYDTLIRSRSISDEERTKMQEQLRQYDGQALRDTKDFSLLKWFHANGVPQLTWNNEKWYGG